MTIIRNKQTNKQVKGFIYPRVTAAVLSLRQHHQHHIIKTTVMAVTKIPNGIPIIIIPVHPIIP